MLRHGHALAILLSLAFCWCVGCQQFHAPVKSFVMTSGFVNETKLANDLKSGGWHVNRNWSPLTETDTRDDRKLGATFRWNSPHAERLVDAAKQVDEGYQKRHHTGQGGFPIGVKITFDSSLKEILRDMAEHPDGTGWSAVVLLAQHDPEAARKYADHLEWLIIQQETPVETATSALRKILPAWAISSSEKDKKQKVAPPISLRAAAAEAWCRVLAANGEDLERDLAPAGNALLETNLPAEVRRQLWRSIASYLPPEQIPLLSEALVADSLGDRAPSNTPLSGKKPVAPPRSGQLEDRRAAAEACLIYAICHQGCLAEKSPEQREKSESGVPFRENGDSDSSPVWPEKFWDLEHDRDAQVRKSFGLALAAAEHPRATAVLANQLQDQEIHVRESAAFGLGWIASSASMSEVDRRLKKEDEHLRKWVVRGVGRFAEEKSRIIPSKYGDVWTSTSSLSQPKWNLEALLPAYEIYSTFSRDHSYLVRQEVARQFSKQYNAESARRLRQFVIDKNLEVQSAVISGIESWPDEWAIPVLLESLSQSALRTRQSALAQLQKRKGEQLHFPLSGDATTRANEAQRLAKIWEVPDPLVKNIRELAVRTSPRAIAQRKAEIRDRLLALPTSGVWADEPALMAWFQGLTIEDLPILEEMVLSAPPEPVRFLREQVLPRLDPAYDALRLLADADVNLRRRGARAISQVGCQRSLSQSVVRRLQVILQGEQDRLVWRFVMQAVTPDASEDAAALAQLAINSSWPDIRILGCEFVGRHGRPSHSPWLIPLFSDESKSVQIAAVSAAGRCRNPLALDGGRIGSHPTPVPGLRHLLHTAQGELRNRTVVSMTCLGDAEAAQELVRMSFDPSPVIRQEVVQAMGLSGQTRFIEPLIRQAWTERHPTVRQAAVTSLEQLVPAEEHPAQLRSRESRNLQQTIEIWAAWWEDHQASVTAGERVQSRPLSRR